MKVAGSSNNELNGNYNFMKMVNRRPMYQSMSGIFAIWYDGQDNWMIGYSTTLAEGTFNTAIAQSNEDAQCPEFGNASTVWWKGQWSSNNNLAVTCIGKI